MKTYNILLFALIALALEKRIIEIVHSIKTGNHSKLKASVFFTIITLAVSAALIWLDFSNDNK